MARPKKTRRSTGTTRKAALSTDTADAALGTLRGNTWLNLAARVLLMAFAIGAGVLAVVYVYLRADVMARILSKAGGGKGSMGDQLLAQTAPVLLLVTVAGLAAFAAAVLHSRGLDESIRTLDSVNRLRREGEVAVSARGLIVAFEEQIATIRRTHTLLVWLGRTLFIVTLGLFAGAVTRAVVFEHVDATTVVMGAASIAGTLLGVVRRVPRNVAHDLANVVQIQLVVTAANRQISLLESGAFAALNSITTTDADAQKVVLTVQARIESLVDKAIRAIEGYADPLPEAPGKVIPLHGARRRKAA
jgi:hypothetical protein